MKILIDADGCPVIGITIKIAMGNNIECIILCDTSHDFSRYDVPIITVPKGADSVDLKLVNMVESGDIIVTQDYGLAALCLAKNGIPISQNGMVYTEFNIDSLLFSRHMSREIRMSGGRLKGSKKRTASQDKEFEQALLKLIEKSYS